MRLGWEVNNPLLGNILTLERRGPLPEVYSFLSCHPANVVVTAYKVCEEGPERGFIIRVWETEGRETEAEIDVSKLDVDSAWRTDLLERDIYELAISDGKLKVKVPARGMATLRVKRRA